MSLYGNNKFYIGTYPLNRTVATTNAANLRNALLLGKFGPGMTDIRNSISSCIYFNFNQNLFEFNRYLIIDGSDIFGNPDLVVLEDISAKRVEPRDTYGFYMGQQLYPKLFNNYLDFEPYTKAQLYLPYFGIVELSIKEIYNKWLIFRLVVDFQTGQGVYYVYASDTFISPISLVDNKRFNLDGLGDSKLVGTYACIIGTEVPLNSTGAADKRRDLIMATANFAINAGVAVATSGLSTPAMVATRVTTPIITSNFTRNVNTNRLNITSKTVQSGVTETTYHNYQSNIGKEMVVETANYAKSIIHNFAATPEQSRAAGTNLHISETQKIHLIIKQCKTVDMGTNYSHLFGKPLGVVKYAKDLDGFTKFSNFHLETNRTLTQENPISNLGLINSEEMDMINDIMTTGAYI